MKTLRERLMAKVVILDSGCWQWTGCVNSRGYSCIGVNGKVQLGHRVSYEIHAGPIPDGLTIDHVCHTRDKSCPGGKDCLHKRCVNPFHLEPVTGEVNSQRSHSVNKSHCVHGHELSGDNLLIKKRKGGRTMRNCRTCNNEQQRLRAFTRRYLDEPVPVVPPVADTKTDVA